MAEQRFAHKSAAVWQIHALGAVACAAVVAGAWLGAVAPAYRSRVEAAAQRQAIAEQEQRLTAAKNRVIQVERALTHVHQAEQDSPLRLDPVSRINQRVSRLSELATDSAVRVTVIKSQQPRPMSRFQAVPIHIEGEATYRNLARFLALVHERFPDVGVAGVRIEAVREDTDGLGRVTLDLVWYAAPSNGSRMADAGTDE